jgi:methanogenic corrinoid protein MtbC1
MRQIAPGEEDLDREVFMRVSAQIATLGQSLPGDAVQTLAREVVERLAKRLATLPVTCADLPSDAEIDRLCHALISDDPDAALRQITRARRNGASPDSVYLAYLAVASRRLGEWWDQDRIPFAAVTVAAGRIYAIMRAVRPAMGPPSGPGRRFAIFASAPGETHTLGVTMAADIFREHGWNIALKVGMGHNELVSDVAASDCTLIGLSASDATSLTALAQLVVSLRIGSPHALIMISGQIVEAHKDIVACLGVDGMASNMNEALVEMRRLMERAQDVGGRNERSATG